MSRGALTRSQSTINHYVLSVHPKVKNKIKIGQHQTGPYRQK